ncbi:MAG: N-acetylmuramoyl-L-alanine amidase [Actinomycetota bacterium]|nr:N-acetylmuramoyl-L-alanine amidase [Actinomycetota bacterium]
MNDVWDGFVRELRRQGLTVKKVPGWKTRTAGGSFTPRGVLIHHTASASVSGDLPCAGICTHGRAGADPLPGPLCNILIGRQGTVLLIAAGRANHAGEGGPHADIPVNQGSTNLVGIECENDGLGEPWPDEQKRVMGIVSATLLKRLDQPARMCFGHKEWTSRKPDPAGIEMSQFRERVQKVLRDLRATGN